MKIFLPFKRSKNSFLDEIESVFKGEFVYGSLDELSDSKYSIVHIHWPEALFNWKEPTGEQLVKLDHMLNNLRTPLVYSKHNDAPHYRDSERFRKLYSLIENKADIIFHFGQYSLERDKNIFKQAKHILLQHPLYQNLPNTITKNEARSHFGFQESDKVILAFGNIRSAQEENFILKVFKKIKIKNKKLVLTNWRDLTSHQLSAPYRSILYRFRKRKFSGRNYIFSNSFIHPDQIEYYFKAADVVLIPRAESLNSGIVYLAATYNCNVVGPEIGNIEENIKRFNGLTFKANNVIDATRSLIKGIHAKFEPINHRKDYNKIIADEYYDYLVKLTTQNKSD